MGIEEILFPALVSLVGINAISAGLGSLKRLGEAQAGGCWPTPDFRVQRRAHTPQRTVQLPSNISYSTTKRTILKGPQFVPIASPPAKISHPP